MRNVSPVVRPRHGHGYRAPRLSISSQTHRWMFYLCHVPASSIGVSWLTRGWGVFSHCTDTLNVFVKPALCVGSAGGWAVERRLCPSKSSLLLGIRFCPLLFLYYSLIAGSGKQLRGSRAHCRGDGWRHPWIVSGHWDGFLNSVKVLVERFGFWGSRELFVSEKRDWSDFGEEVRGQIL